MKRISERRRKRIAEARPVRQGLLREFLDCMICGHSPRRPWRDKPRECSQTCCHEIANGVNRDKALDQPYAILVLCWWCNGHEVTDKAKWPEARQLAVLQERAPHHYNLVAYLKLTNPRAPNRITQEEVDAWRSGSSC